VLNLYLSQSDFPEDGGLIVNNPLVDPSADVDSSAVLGSNTRVWHLVQIRNDVVIGDDCIIGRGAYIGTGVAIGDKCKIQNYALVYEPAVVESGVFIGPAVVLTNDTYPRAINSDGGLKNSNDWDAVGVTVRSGASIGARSVCVAPLTIGRWAMIGAGSTVIKDVPDFALMVGVPARRVGWVGPAGQPLKKISARMWECPVSKSKFKEISSDEIREESN
jgi:acetyltransferase-like isoleucine patch superfamily enzyme